jgi:hypothetical protein
MNKELVSTAVCLAIITGMIAALFVDVPLASAQDDPRSDKACENMLDLEGKQDVRTEPDSTLPDSDQGAQKAHEGSVKALGNCPAEP